MTMSILHIPNRPFASELITGLALPDGIFEIALGQQMINAHVRNTGNAAVTNTSIYLESVSDPGIVIAPATQVITSLPQAGARVFSWRADFTKATPGKKLVSFVCVDGSGAKTRIIKQIFVTRTTYDATTNTVSMETPQGILKAGFPLLVRPVDDGCGGGGGGCGGGGGGCGCCCVCKHTAAGAKRLLTTFSKDVALLPSILGAAVNGQLRLCPTWYLPQGIGCVWMPNPPYAGPYGALPFEDPWWKILLCIVAVILLVAASIVSGGSITLGNGDPSGMGKAGSGQNCCGLAAGGSTSSYVAAGLVAAAAACVTAAGLSDVRDPVRRGQDHTAPGPGELTVAESMYAELEFPESVVLGQPFAIGAKWKYKRTTNMREYLYSAHEVRQNVHVLSKYEVTAPNINHQFREEPWIVRAQFWDIHGKLMTGADLFVQCFLIGPTGQVIKLLLQDDGVAPDAKANDGTYTAFHRFLRDAEGLWKYFVIAQDVNNAQPDMSPEQAAQIIGGMVRTHQLTISFQGGTCKLVPDGYVNVVGGVA
jgi:hypothetical protein